MSYHMLLHKNKDYRLMPSTYPYASCTYTVIVIQQQTPRAISTCIPYFPCKTSPPPHDTDTDTDTCGHTHNILLECPPELRPLPLELLRKQSVQHQRSRPSCPLPDPGGRAPEPWGFGKESHTDTAQKVDGAAVEHVPRDGLPQDRGSWTLKRGRGRKKECIDSVPMEVSDHSV